MFIDEKDENNELIIDKFGEIIFDIEEGFDINDRNIRIDMKMGGTKIICSAVYLRNGKHIEITQHFC